uniref:Pectinesterase n=1 Tax=Medicago truncatula TaxID=3880 RepID=A2Q1D4_MEDTR|nr:Pectinesterase [Medicago truncatula]
MSPSRIFFLFCFFFRTSSSDILDTITQKGKFPSWVKPGDRKLLQASAVPADAVVASDGSGNYMKIMDAVMAAPNGSKKRYVIHIKKGVYNEHVMINNSKSNLMMIGDGMGATVITGDLSWGRDKLDTSYTYTFGVEGLGFSAQDISFRNTAWPENHQAVALLSDSDTSVFYRCEISGFQDSLCANIKHHSIRIAKSEARLTSYLVRQLSSFKTDILVRKGPTGQQNTITAQGGPEKPNLPFGFAFQFCNVCADPEFLPFVNLPKHSSEDRRRLEALLTKWNNTAVYLDTLYYAEYNNHGSRAAVQNRVKWPGYHAGPAYCILRPKAKFRQSLLYAFR